ncbi:hypothetical protein [Flexivirga oryzae]|uniref:Uncharacterized membrane protein YozB (DUF420 family) n=1 Tax=Flexivirga oryzae TaxID=1794944 RepID=A0A839N8Q3_9MICO|nr:hypothetical protein [Flexivirga oryzae]MBB2892384.1 uncharacterized membrane protein YozB (DUF420 family) [Flexivirga oryzae]
MNAHPPASKTAPIVMACAGALVFIGGQIHPKGPLDENLHTLEGNLLSDSDRWDSTHAVLAVAIVVMTAGLVLMLRHQDIRTDRILHTATVVALVGMVISWAEMAFHIAMTSEAHALLTGGPTPLFDTHVVLQAIYTPLFGWGVAVMALRGGATRRWGNPWIAILGVVGGIVFGCSGPAVALWPNSHDSLLFIGDAPLGLWAVASGLWVLRASFAHSRPRSEAGIL